MKLRSFVVVLLLPATCLALKPLDPMIDRWLAIAYRAGYFVICKALLAGAALAFAGILLEATIKGLRRHPKHTERPTDQHVA